MPSDDKGERLETLIRETVAALKLDHTTSKTSKSVPEDLDVVSAKTPSLVASRINNPPPFHRKC